MAENLMPLLVIGVLLGACLSAILFGDLDYPYTYMVEEQEDEGKDE